jgi:uncharacterized protein with von Willebrand factor type A (vWA) domain
MRRRLQEFVGALRSGGVSVSLAESLDAMRAVAAVGIERPRLREALAACLVKDERDRSLFDSLFDEYFPLVEIPGGGGRRRRRGAPGSDGGARPLSSAAGGAGAPGGAGSSPPSRRDDVRMPRRQPVHPSPSPLAASEGRPAPAPPPARAADRTERGRERPLAIEDRPGTNRGRQRARQDLLRKPFAEHTPADVEEAHELVAVLARELQGRIARRLRRARRGRIDIRRTLRRATATGGVAIRLEHRGPRPGRPNLVALCDVSGSVAAVSELLLGLIAPAAAYFRAVEIFVYVDRLVPATFEGGRLVHEPGLDRHAYSDFGRVLAEYCAGPGAHLDRNTVVVILGDARNNRRPPRAPLLEQIRARARSVVWLNPEPVSRWNTGDSVIALYARSCTTVLECSSLGALVAALGRVF